MLLRRSAHVANPQIVCGDLVFNGATRDFTLAGVCGIPSDATSVYIREGVCPNLVDHALWSCLRSR